MAINPAAVGAAGFTALLIEPPALLSLGEQTVIGKIGLGILLAFTLAGGISDLKRITELGTQELLQLG